MVKIFYSLFKMLMLLTKEGALLVLNGQGGFVMWRPQGFGLDAFLLLK